jgi:hypothetical protein
MAFSILLALSGLTLSAVAIYYSVIGLTAVFAASFWAVAIMGTTLEVSKLVAASWLKAYWERIPLSMKIYMSTAVVVLMVITSMGIFGFLSKAHLDQNIVSGDVQSKIVLVDEKIKIERENIANAQQVIKQMDAAVTGVIATGDQTVTLRDGSTRVNSAAERSLQIRRSQAKDRDTLTKQIEQAQSRIVTLQEEVAPIRAEMRQVEAKVGPIKYIAALIYGDNPDANILEKAVTWVIMIIVFVFDPLAVLMLLGAQMTWKWHREEKQQLASKNAEPVPTVMPPINNDSDDLVEEANAKLSEIEKPEVEFDLSGWEKVPPTVARPEYKVIDDADEETVEQFDLLAHARSHTPLKDEQLEIVEEVGVEQWNKMIEEAERELENEKEAKRIWKEQHPDDTLKHQERLKDAGIIEQLPWESESDRPGDYLTELESKKKTTYVMKEQNHQVTKTKE